MAMNEITEFELHAHSGEPRDTAFKFRTMIGIESELEIPKVEKVCSDIKKNDNTFDYEIKKTRIKKFKAVLTVYSETLEMANERGGWFIHKCRNCKVASYFWVRPIEKAGEE